MNKLTPEYILQILHSFTKIQVVDNEVEVLFGECTAPMASIEFISNTFTKDLIELIEYHLIGPAN